MTNVFRQHENVIIEPISHHFRVQGKANKWKGGESSAGGFRKKEVHEGDESRGETHRRDGKSGTVLSEAASLEIASKSLVSVTLASACQLVGIDENSWHTHVKNSFGMMRYQIIDKSMSKCTLASSHCV